MRCSRLLMTSASSSAAETIFPACKTVANAPRNPIATIATAMAASMSVKPALRVSARSFESGFLGGIISFWVEETNFLLSSYDAACATTSGSNARLAEDGQGDWPARSMRSVPVTVCFTQLRHSSVALRNRAG